MAKEKINQDWRQYPLAVDPSEKFHGTVLESYMWARKTVQ